MRNRSRMAAGSFVACVLAFAALSARAADNVPPQVVKLDLHIAGLGPDGCDIEIKPAYAGSRFTPVREHVRSDGNKLIKLEDVHTQSADRECAFAITIREPGQAARTIKRGVRLVTPKNSTGPATLACFINSPSSLARAEQRGRVRR